MSVNASLAQNTDSLVNGALGIAKESNDEINAILSDIQGVAGTSDHVNILGDQTTPGSSSPLSGSTVLADFSITGGTVDITSAGGAMIIDDLMQKISTKVQVAAQLLATGNNITKTVNRELKG